MRTLSDEQLMQQYAADDMDAFEVLYARYRGPLYRYFRRQVADPATANDLYQGCWEKIISARHRYRPSAPFKAWAYRIAHNHLVDHYRRQRPGAPLDEAGFVDAGPGPDQALDAEHRHDALHAAILALPPEQRDALLLKLEGGLSLAEIATMTDVGRETVKSRLRYATARLKQVLQP
jgi:RNA polymerase sigma-70 factor (ECF subfamily)